MLFSVTPFWGAAAVSEPAFFFLLRDPVPPPLAMIVCVVYSIYKGLKHYQIKYTKNYDKWLKNT